MSHPRLPCGYNSWENAGDEVNSSGVNEAIWPVLFETFESLEVLIVTEAMLALFDECPDYVVACSNDNIMIPAEPETLVIRGHR